MFNKKQSAPAHHFDLVEILEGLSPTLVADLANFAGCTRRDLLVSFQVMPWGDRATLAAFGILELEPTSGGSGRVVTVSPITVELVKAAEEVVSGGIALTTLGDP